MIKSPFDIVNIINNKSAHDRDEVMAMYNAWMINRAFANMPDTVLFADIMNRNSALRADIQFDFYLSGIPKGKRFGTWHKDNSKNDEVINMLCERLDINRSLAKKYISLLSEEEKQQLLQCEGGT